jgi:hypothetical protein
MEGDSMNAKHTPGRLAACWNACEGLHTESLERDKPLADQLVDALNQRDELRSENERLRGDCVEWLCVKCNCVHPCQRRGFFQPCPTCTAAMLPTSFNLRTIDKLTAQRDELLEALREIETFMGADFDDLPMAKARAAIAKATGSQS